MAIDVKAFVEQIEKDPHSCSLWNWCNGFTASEEDTVYLVRGILKSEAQARAEGERLTDETNDAADLAYNSAIDDALYAIRALKVEGE